jgi:hypothetical protein
MRLNPIRISRALAATALGLVLVACSQGVNLPGMPKAEKPKEPAGMSSVSAVEPKAGAPVTSATAFENRPLAASKGECGPRYANGERGTCVNNRPCRGFAMTEKSGAIVCRCWAKEGGCGETERCDGVRKECVPEKSASWGRADVD